MSARTLLGEILMILGVLTLIGAGIVAYLSVTGIWRFLTHATADEIRRIPEVEHVDDLPAWVPQEAKDLVGFLLNAATIAPCKQLSSGRRKLAALGRKLEGWNDARRELVASQVKRISHWQIVEGDYFEIPNKEATWFIDPPYNNPAGRYYPFHEIDYAALGGWCRSRNGQAIVCENEGADRLPFRPFGQLKPNPMLRGKPGSREVIWTNEEPGSREVIRMNEGDPMGKKKQSETHPPTSEEREPSKYVEAEARIAADTESTEASEALTYISTLHVSSPETYEIAIKTIQAIKERREKVEALRKSLVGPLNGVVKKINELFKPAIGTYDNCEGLLKQRVLEWRRQADAERERLLQEAQAQVKAGDSIAAATAVVEASRVIVPGVGAFTERKKWTGAVEDASKIPREYLTPDLAKLQAATTAAGGDPKIPGWKAWEESVAIVRKG